VLFNNRTRKKERNSLYYSLLYLKVHLEFQNIADAGTACGGKYRPEEKGHNN